MYERRNDLGLKTQHKVFFNPPEGKVRSGGYQQVSAASNSPIEG
jgi:hypothetical protein